MKTDFKKAIQLVDLKRYADARKMLVDLLAHNPEGVHILLLLTKIAHLEDKHQECIQHSQLCLALEPELSEAVYLRGISHCQLEESSVGIKLIEEAIQMEPEESTYKLGLAQVLIGINYRKEAEELCRDVLYYDSENAVAFALLAYLAQEKGNKKEAQLFRDEALRLDPHDTGIKALVGNLKLSDKDRSLSAALLREAVLTYPEDRRLREKLIDAELSKNGGFYAWVVMKYNLVHEWGYVTTVVGVIISIGVASGLHGHLSFTLVKILLIGLSIWQLLFWTLRLWSHFTFYKNEWRLGLRNFLSPQYLVHGLMMVLFVTFLIYLNTGYTLWLGASLMIGLLSLMILIMEEKLKGKKELTYARWYVGGVALFGLFYFISHWAYAQYTKSIGQLLFLSMFGVLMVIIFYGLIAEVILQVKDRTSREE